MDDSQTLARWVAQGEMDTQRILARIGGSFGSFGEETGHGSTKLEETFDKLASYGIDGRRIREDAVFSYLRGKGAVPPLLSSSVSIIYQSLLYLSRFPFVNEQPKAMNYVEFRQALALPQWELSRRLISDDIWQGRFRTIADHRRMLFQSLATGRDGQKLSFDAEDWKIQAGRRASELHPGIINDNGNVVRMSNFDRFGDEMYYDTLDIIYATQITRLPFGPVRYECFRQLARSLHGNNAYLPHLTVSSERLRCLVKLLLITQLGIQEGINPFWYPDLDETVNCIINSFRQNSDIGITWPMFYDAMRVMV